MTESVSDVAPETTGLQNPSSTTSEYLQPNRVVVNLGVGSRKRLFEQFAELIACTMEVDQGDGSADQIQDQPSLEQIFDTLHDRERLGSTGLGKGIALPHGRIDGLAEPVIAIAKLENPIDYDSPDGLPVWLAVCLLVPNEANQIHLNLLAALATKFSDDEFVQQVKQAETTLDLYNLFSVV